MARWTRRQWMARSVAAVSAPWVVPARVLGRGDATPPSECIILGGIGLGHRGQDVLRWMLQQPDVRFVAICDVQRVRREQVKAIVERTQGVGSCATYRDIRQFLSERTDVEAVLIATSDRWHALASVWAMRAGKDVYCEKPSSMTVAEGRAVVETARKYGRVYQTGTQRLSAPHHVTVFELARQGRLGRVHTAYAHIADGATVLSVHWRGEEPLPPPDELDWDAWLGPCPWRPYHSSYVQGGWRGDDDFHTGAIGEWGAHTIAQCLQAIEPPCGPVRIIPAPNVSGDGCRLVFSNGITLVLEQGRRRWRGACGEWIEGDEGYAAAADGYSQPHVSSPALLRESSRLLSAYRLRTGRALDHVRNFLDCIRRREDPVANAEVMHRSMSLVHAANIAQRLQRELVYDWPNDHFVDAPDADRYLARVQRAPWTMG